MTPISPRDLPQRFRWPWAILMLVLSGVVGAVAAIAVVRTEAETVVTKVWSERQHAEVVGIATEAARVGASQAIADQFRSEIAPLASELKSHESMDDQRVADLRERVGRLEGRVDRIEGHPEVTRR